MYNEKKILAIIPARGGSKGLPGKNIKLLNDKPLIGWTIEQAKSCSYIDEIFISTDSKEIASVGEEFGIRIPSLRPSDLAQDTSSSIDVILFTISLLEQEKKKFDIIILLEATSPLRDNEDLENALEILVDTEGAESIVGVSRTENAHPAFLVSLGEKNFIKSYKKNEFILKRRQEIDDLYFFEGSLYMSYVESLKMRKSFYHEKTLGFKMPKYKSFEIDDIIDFKIIEALMKAKLNKEI
jgi:N-acylneuraminate cytidylyltransferase/CMP-N,N'-diacetyllegionaminic acid synthase